MSPGMLQRDLSRRFIIIIIIIIIITDYLFAPTSECHSADQLSNGGNAPKKCRLYSQA